MAIDYASLDSAVGLNWYLTDPDLRTLMDRYVPPERRQWAEGHLVRWGELCGGPIARRAEIIDRNPPRLRRYDEWGNEVFEVVHHPDAVAVKRDIWEQGPQALESRGEEMPTALGSAFTYLLSQADTGMVCATGMTGGVAALVDRYAPQGLRELLLARLRAAAFDDGWDGAMFMTEIRGGSDLAQSETKATPDGDTWRLNGSKWFCSNVDAGAIVTLARPEGAPPGLAGLALFLVPAARADGSRNGIVIKRIKDKLGTRSVPTAEVDFVDAEAHALSSPGAQASEARGLNRMMSMVNGSRLGVAFMGLGIARRSFLEAAMYAARRQAFGRRLDELPLVRRTLVQMVVEVEAAAVLCFETSSLAAERGDEESRRLYRILVPVSKLRAARAGLELASQGLEILGGNGYIEDWPTARLFRDAQCHTIWEGTENIISLDVLRAMRKEDAHDALLARVDAALEPAGGPLAPLREVVRGEREEVGRAVAFLEQAPEDVRQLQARTLGSWLADVTQAALLLEQAADELKGGSARKAAVARFFVQEHLAPKDMRGISEDRSALALFDAVTRYERLDPAALPSDL